jgi:hypothetical protein
MLRDTVFVRVAVDEHDLNNGLHDRVTLTDAGLLRDTLVLADGDMRLIDTLGDLLFDTGMDFVGVTLNPKLGVRLGDAIAVIVLELDLVIDLLLELDTLWDLLLEILFVFVAVLVEIKLEERVSDAETLTDRDIVPYLDGDGVVNTPNETVLDGVAVRETNLEPLGETDSDLVRDDIVVSDMEWDGVVVSDLEWDGMVVSDLVWDGETETVLLGDCVCASVSNIPNNSPLRVIAYLLMIGS